MCNSDDCLSKPAHRLPELHHPGRSRGRSRCKILTLTTQALFFSPVPIYHKKIPNSEVILNIDRKYFPMTFSIFLTKI